MISNKPLTKFAGLSPFTTDLLRRRLAFQQKSGEVVVGRTIASFKMSASATDQLLDHLIATEIPGSGATSKEVKKLRDVRHRLQNTLRGDEDTGVTVRVPSTVDRERLLRLLGEFYWNATPQGSAETAMCSIDAMAGVSSWSSPQEFSEWLAEVL